MFYRAKKRYFGTAFKSMIALVILPVWMVSMSYCTLASTIKCKPTSFHETNCHGHSHADSHSTKSAPKEKGEICCESVKTVVLPVSNVIFQHPSFAQALWGFSDLYIYDLIKRGQPSGFCIYDHGPPGSSIILVSLRYSHQENAPPQSV